MKAYQRKIIVLILITISTTSCNLYRQIGRNVIRKHNTSFNKYNEKNSYLSYEQLVKEQNKLNKKNRENKFLLWLWINI